MVQGVATGAGGGGFGPGGGGQVLIQAGPGGFTNGGTIDVLGGPGGTNGGQPGGTGVVTINVVPSPASLVLLGTGLLGPLGVWWLGRGRTHVAGGVSAR